MLGITYKDRKTTNEWDRKQTVKARYALTTLAEDYVDNRWTIAVTTCRPMVGSRILAKYCIQKQFKGLFLHENTVFISNPSSNLRSKNWRFQTIWQLKIDHRTICDPAPLNEALWGDYQNQEWWFIAINTIFCTFWCKNGYSTTFLSKVTVCWTSSCMISLKTTL